ncbi:hypothetical protein BD626DRAFT_145015 [Schizophyllum amplum]|uniref:Uncharacterized protein n=1 Tax=Schizophyllum amplum TaxID=97359 RepID=A0A550C500_9AGAR|nr:hypothetical protein BD626DRAFT_145015 [Auriculariopsis ampla]
MGVRPALRYQCRRPGSHGAAIDCLAQLGGTAILPEVESIAVLGRQIRRPPIRWMMADTRGADPSQRHHGLSAETLRRLSTKTPERRQNLPTVQSALVCIIGRPINVYKYSPLVVALTLSTAESTRVDGVSAESLCEESARTLRGGSSQRPPMAETIY